MRLYLLGVGVITIGYWLIKLYRFCGFLYKILPIVAQFACIIDIDKLYLRQITAICEKSIQKYCCEPCGYWAYRVFVGGTTIGWRFPCRCFSLSSQSHHSYRLELCAV